MEENICRLCFSLVKSEFEVIDAVVKQMMDVLSLNMDLEASEDPILCRDCAQILKKSYLFKSTCIDTAEIIRSFSTTKEGAKFNMKDVYKDSKGVQTVVDEELSVCRFCMNETGSSSCVSLDKLMNDDMYMEIFQAVMPHTVLNVIRNPVICTSCWESLECYFKFTRNCSHIENEINKYRQSNLTDSNTIILSNVFGFLFKDTSTYPNNCGQITEIKQETLFENVEQNAGFEIHEEQVKCEEEIDIKDEYSDSENSRKNMREVKMYKCEKCTFEAKYKRSIRRHMLSHKDTLEVKLHKCTVCPHEAKSKDNLKRHMLSHKDTSEVKMHRCTLCTFETKYKDYLRNHMLSHKDASEVEMHKCGICTYNTKYKNNLKTHMLKHSEVKMYKCEVCTYESQHKCNMRKHVLIHGTTSDIKKNKCGICTYETKYKNYLKKHMLTHKDVSEVEMYRCGICTFETKHKEVLKRHSVTHKGTSDVQMYKCDICTYETKYRRGLVRHILNHKEQNRNTKQ